MATFGQGINASLGRIDYSPFLQGASQGAQMRAQGMQQLGAGISQGIQQYQANKKLALDAQNEFEEVASVNPSVLEWLQSKQAPEAAQKAFVKMQKNGTLGLNDATTLSSAARGFLKSEQIKQIKAQQDFQNSIEQQKLKIEKDRVMNERIASMRQMFGGEAKGPSVPSGYRMSLTGGLEPIPGGPADPKAEGTPAQLAVAGAEREAAKQTASELERVEKKKADEKLNAEKIAGRNAAIDQTLSTVKEAYELSSAGAGGPIEGIGWVAAGENIAGRGKHKNLLNLIGTIKASLSIENLQKMRRESPTGGAVGNVSDKDLELLGSDVANLDPTLQEAELRKRLKKIAGTLHRMKIGTGSGPRIVAVEPIN